MVDTNIKPKTCAYYLRIIATKMLNFLCAYEKWMYLSIASYQELWLRGSSKSENVKD